MTYAQARLDELEKIGRKRDLTDDEVRECMMRARQVRANDKRKRRYAQDPIYRQSRIDQSVRRAPCSHSA